MKNIEALIELIEKGDATVILAEKNLSDSFNELLKYELIDYHDGKIFLTPKGQEAKIRGFNVVLQQLQQGNRVQKRTVQPVTKFSFQLVLAVLLTFLSIVGYLLLHTLELI